MNTVQKFKQRRILKGQLGIILRNVGKNIIKRTPVKQIFETNRWNRFRDPKYVTQQDLEITKSLLPEYNTIQEKALDEGKYMIVSEDSPLAPLAQRLEDGRLLFTGDEGTWIQSQSDNFKSRAKGSKKIKVGFKGGTDQKIEGASNAHAPETFPDQENGVFFAGPQGYANTYNMGKEAPGFWLFFDRPYDMLEGGQKPFLLEDENVRFVRGVESSLSFRGEIPDQTINTLHKVWNSEYLNDPEIMKIVTGDPNKMTSEQLALRTEIYKRIRQGQDRQNYGKLQTMTDARVKSGQFRPTASYHDGFIGRDHTLGWGIYKNGVISDEMWPWGGNPETFVITKPQQAKLLVGNNGLFNDGAVYSRKKGGNIINKYQYNIKSCKKKKKEQ